METSASFEARYAPSPYPTEGMVHRPRCGEGSCVVPAVPYLSAAAELAVHGPGEADGEPADSTGTRAPVLGLHDQMEVIVLDRKFDDPELGARGRGKGAAHGGEEPAGAKAADLIHGPKRHVNGMGGDVPGPRPMRDARPSSWSGLATGAGSAPAPGTRRGQGELKGSTRRHLIRLI